MRQSVVAWLAASALCALLAGCAGAQPAAIKGTVTDNFGQPVAGAAVQIVNSAFEAETDDKGLFSIEYVPGSFVVSIAAEGHSSREISLDLRERSEYPLNATVLTRFPEGKGLYLLGSTDYVPLLPARIGSTERSAGMNVVKSYVVEATATWADGIAPIAEALAIPEDAALAEFTVVDTTGDQFDAYLSDGNRLGTATYGPLGSNEDGMVAIGEIGREEPASGVVFRRFAAPAPALLEGRAICFPRVGRNMIARRLIIGEGDPGYCLAVAQSTDRALQQLDRATLVDTLARQLIHVGVGFTDAKLGDDQTASWRLLGIPTNIMEVDHFNGYLINYEVDDNINVQFLSDKQTRKIRRVRVYSSDRFVGDWSQERIAGLREKQVFLPKMPGGASLYSTPEDVVSELGEPHAIRDVSCGGDVGADDQRVLVYGTTSFHICDVVVDISVEERSR